MEAASEVHLYNDDDNESTISIRSVDKLGRRKSWAQLVKEEEEEKERCSSLIKMGLGKIINKSLGGSDFPNEICSLG